jgi:acetyltransferase-like isoleucine patch superfamily enzyme
MDGPLSGNRADGVSAAMALPRSLGDYARSPRRSLGMLREWLNARWQLRACTARGRWTRVTGRPFINNKGEMLVGDRVRIHSHYARSVYVTLPGGRLEIGAGTFINYGADIAATSLVRIGADCLIGTHCMILDNDFHDLVDRERLPAGRSVEIGDRVWIGNRVIILPGSRIGAGAVIGAGSVVKGEVPAGALAAGNPARIIRQLERDPAGDAAP